MGRAKVERAGVVRLPMDAASLSYLVQSWNSLDDAEWIWARDTLESVERGKHLTVEEGKRLKAMVGRVIKQKELRNG